MNSQNIRFGRVNSKPILEFFEVMKCPNYDECQYKIVNLLDAGEEALTTEHLDDLDWLFYTILLTPHTLKMLYDNQY